MQTDPSLPRRFAPQFHLPDYSPADIAKMCRLVATTRLGLSVAIAPETQLVAHIDVVHGDDIAQNNGGLAMRLAKEEDHRRDHRQADISVAEEVAAEVTMAAVMELEVVVGMCAVRAARAAFCDRHFGQQLSTTCAVDGSTRMACVQQQLLNFCDNLEQLCGRSGFTRTSSVAAFGIVTFDDTYNTPRGLSLLPATSVNIADIESAINNLTPVRQNGAEARALALHVCLTMEPDVVFFLGDGEWDRSPSTELLSVASASGDSIPVHTIDCF
jgi:hypothetical protein